MDILDSLTQHKHSKNKTSILSNATPVNKNQQIKISTFAPYHENHSVNSSSNPASNFNINRHLDYNSIQNKSNQIEKQAVFVGRNQHASYQHLKEVHFDIHTHTVIDKGVESHKDAHSISDQANKAFVPIPESLGVIQSENSQDSKQSAIPALKSRSSKPAVASSSSCPAEHTQLLQKLQKANKKSEELQRKVEDLQNKLKLKQKNEVENLHYINQLKNRVKEEHQRGIEQRNKAIEDQKASMEQILKRVQFCHEEELNKKRQILQWQFSKKEQLLTEEIQNLKFTINRYQQLLNSESQFLKCMQTKNQEQGPVKVYPQPIKYNCSQCYQYKQQYEKHNIQQQQNKKDYEQQKYKIKRERVQLQAQTRRRQNQFQAAMDKRIKEIEKKQRELIAKTWEIDAQRQIIEHQKQQRAEMNDKWNQQYRNNVEQLNNQKIRVYQLEKQLLEKLNIVQMYGNRKIQSATINSKLQTQSPEESIVGKQNLSVSREKKKESENRSPKKEVNYLFQDNKLKISSYISQVNKAMNPASKAKGGRAIYKLLQYYK